VALEFEIEIGTSKMQVYASRHRTYNHNQQATTTNDKSKGKY
jgi:hypothetical protein